MIMGDFNHPGTNWNCLESAAVTGQDGGYHHERE